MNARKVCCQGCGADLDIAEDLRFVTCNFCGSKLEIVHDKTTTHSRLLEKIGRQTNEMAGDLKVIKLQNELERLDREWERFRGKTLVSDKNGNISEPSAGGTAFGGIFGIVGAIAFIFITSQGGAPAFVPLFGIVIIAFALFNMSRGLGKAHEFSATRSKYEAKRREILRRIEGLKMS